jgi:hypothetical protein
VAAPKALSAYDLLLQTIQQQKLQQQNLASMPDSSSDVYPQGGLLGRLLAVQSSQNQQPSVLNNEKNVSQPSDPNFRQLSRLV